MEPAQLVLPVLATSALGVALFVPLRDDRLGRRATRTGGNVALRPDFGALTYGANDASSTNSHEANPTSNIAERADQTVLEADPPSKRDEFARIPETTPRHNEPRRDPASGPPPEPERHANATADASRAREGNVEIGRARGSASGAADKARSLETPSSPISAASAASDRSGAWAAANLRAAPHASPESRAGAGGLSTTPTLHVDPIALFAAVWQRFVSRPRVSKDATSAAQEVFAERSFAGELASLLGPAAPGRQTPATLEDSQHSVVESTPEVRGVSDIADASQIASACGLEKVGEVRDLAERIDVATAEESAERTAIAAFLNDTNDDESARTSQPIIVQAARTFTDRVVPLTRLPLRPQSREITWYSPLEENASLSAPERYTLLERLVEDPSQTRIGTLTQAYHEEDAQGRVLALLALASHRASGSRGTFVDALRNGTDDERVVAVDALASLDAREELPPAFNDRVDAIAARAALAYVGTNIREEYRNALEPHVDPGRLDAILALLAGFVE